MKDTVRVIVEECEYASQISKAILAFMDYYTNDWSGLPSTIGGKGPYAHNQVSTLASI